MGVLIIGAGLAGMRVAQGLRRRGCGDAITVVGAEPHTPYDRPPLSKESLRGERDLPELLTARSLAELDLDLRLGVRATALDRVRRVVHTDAGELPYTRLVIATGAEPARVPGVGGLVLRTWGDVLVLRKALTPGSTLAVVGAGLIGCEVAASARHLGVEVHLIDIADAPMSRVLGTGLDSIARNLHESNGVRFHLGTRIASATGMTVVLSDGSSIAADTVLHAVGARPNPVWLAGTGLDDPYGIPCDASGRTAIPDVFAVGDAAAWEGRRAEHWTSAADQADAVASYLSGSPPPPTWLPYWWSDQYHVRFQGLGSIEGADEVRLRRWGPTERHIALYARAGRLAAAVGLSAARALMFLRADIEKGTPVDEVDERLAALGVARPRPVA